MITSAYEKSSAYATLAQTMRTMDASMRPQGQTQGLAQGMGAAGSTGGNSSVSVHLSPQAQAMAMRETDPTAYYSRFFPTRDGEPATALAAAVADPGRESSSAGLNAQEVAADARARMDAKYEEMEAAGRPFGSDNYEGKDWYELTGDLDRRSLNAVATNAEGLFSSDEQDMARSIMYQQQGLATGVYGGPTSQKGYYVDTFAGDTQDRMEATVAFLDKVSADEKATVAWASSRASAQIAYQNSGRTQIGLAKRLDSELPLVQLITSAMDTAQGDMSRGLTRSTIHTAEDLQRQPWFQGFEGRLSQAINDTATLLGVT